MYPTFYDDAPYLRRDLTIMPIKCLKYLKIGFWNFFKNCTINFCWRWSKLKIEIVLWFPFTSMANQIAELFDQRYLKRVLMNCYDFWHGDRHLRNEVILLAGCGQPCLNVSKIVGWGFGYQIKKRMEDIVWMRDWNISKQEEWIEWFHYFHNPFSQLLNAEFF